MKDLKSSDFLKSKHGRLHYVKYGEGSKVLLLFHGFGQDHSIGASFADQLKSSHTIYSFDLPFHGMSDWEEVKYILSKEDVKEMFKQWLSENEIDEFAVLGYSMGGKFAITLAEMLPDNVHRLIMIAPDGLYKSPWYQLATSLPFDALFNQIVDKPKFFFALTRLVSKTNLVSDKLIQFGELQMATRKLRSMVYYTWHNFQKLFIDKSVIKNNIKSENLQAVLIVGGKDTIIKPKKVVPIVQNLGFQVIVLEADHARVLGLAVEDIFQYLK